MLKLQIGELASDEIAEHKKRYAMKTPASSTIQQDAPSEPAPNSCDKSKAAQVRDLAASSLEGKELVAAAAQKGIKRRLVSAAKPKKNDGKAKSRALQMKKELDLEFTMCVLSIGSFLIFHQLITA